MSGASRETVEFELELHPALAAAVEHVGAAWFKTDLEAGIERNMRRLGLSSTAAVTIAATGSRAVSLRTAGATLPYPPTFLTRLWFAITPLEPTIAAGDSPDDDGFPDGWLIAGSEALVHSGDARGCRAVAELVAQLTLEALTLRPSSMLTSHESAALLAGGEAEPVLGEPDGSRLLSGLLDLGVSLREPERIRQVVRAVRASQRSVPDTLEEVFARLRGRTVRVLVERRAYAELTTEPVAEDRVSASDPRVKPEVREVVEVVFEHRLRELGLRLPVEFIRVANYERPEIRLVLNDRTSPSIPIPGVDEVAVTATPARLTELGIDSRRLVDAVTGREAAAVALADRGRLEDAGLLPIPQYAYAAAAFARAATPLAHRLISINEVEEDLAALEEDVPTLVHATLARYTLGDITRVLRALVREQVSIRDLRRILNVLLAFGDAAPDDVQDIFLEDRLPDPGDPETPVWVSWVEPRLLAFVRAELGDRVCYDARIAAHDATPVPVYETDESFEALIEAVVSTRDGAAEALLRTIRAEVWRALQPADREPVLVTSARTRLALRRALELELPAARVLARAELPATLRTRAAGSITAPA